MLKHLLVFKCVSHSEIIPNNSSRPKGLGFQSSTLHVYITPTKKWNICKVSSIMTKTSLDKHMVNLADIAFSDKNMNQQDKE